MHNFFFQQKGTQNVSAYGKETCENKDENQYNVIKWNKKKTNKSIGDKERNRNDKEKVQIGLNRF